MKWLGYRRVSSVGGRGERLISPELQAKRVSDYAAGRGYEVEMLPAELNVSGGKRSRPILDAAIGRIERGEAAGIIVAALDRLSRMTLTDALATLEQIEGAGGQVASVAENVDSTTPEGRMARNVFLSMAEMQRARYREHTMASKRQAVERGIWPMSVVPLGYVKGTERSLQPGPDAAEVRRAFELRAAGAPWSKLMDVLGLGLSGAGKLIRNRVYLGEIRLTIDGEVVVNSTAHEPLIHRDLWEAAQIVHPYPARSGEVSLLSGLIRCAHCSQLMSPGGGQYRCYGRKVAGRCLSPALISKRLVEPHVERLVLSHLSQMRVSATAVEVGEEEQRVLAVAERELAAFQEGIAVSAVGAEFFASGMRTRVEAVEAARRALGRVRGAIAQGVPPVRADLVYGKLGVEERRHVLRSALGVVWVWKGRGLERVKLIEVGAEPSRLSRPGLSVPLVAVEWGDLPGELRVTGS